MNEMDIISYRSWLSALSIEELKEEHGKQYDAKIIDPEKLQSVTTRLDIIESRKQMRENREGRQAEDLKEYLKILKEWEGLGVEKDRLGRYSYNGEMFFSPKSSYIDKRLIEMREADKSLKGLRSELNGEN